MKNILINLSIIISLFFCSTLQAQSNDSLADKPQKMKLSFRDSEDGAIDLSDWIIYYNGFIPVPAIITEPAIGGFGLALAPVFIKQNKPVEHNGKLYPVAPDIAAIVGGYTANKSWASGGGISLSSPKYGLQYKLFGGYGDINMDLYFNTKLNDAQKISFNFSTVPIFGSIAKRLGDPRFTGELEYMFIDTKVKLADPNDILPDFISEKEMDSRISKIGTKVAFDSRDNVFTPNKGIRTYIDLQLSAEFLGSNYNYEQVEAAFYYFYPIKKWWISGVRLDIQQAFDAIPFYLMPMVDMRGIPMGRFMGKTSMLAELEERFDVYKRWSIVAFGGLGTAFDKWSEIADAELAASYGGGFRYLIARKLNLRMGIDFAYSNIDQFAWYIIFGTSWVRQ